LFSFLSETVNRIFGITITALMAMMENYDVFVNSFDVL